MVVLINQVTDCCLYASQLKQYRCFRDTIVYEYSNSDEMHMLSSRLKY
jgi:hypothetical protein